MKKRQATLLSTFAAVSSLASCGAPLPGEPQASALEDTYMPFPPDLPPPPAGCSQRRWLRPDEQALDQGIFDGEFPVHRIAILNCDKKTYEEPNWDNRNLSFAAAITWYRTTATGVFSDLVFYGEEEWSPNYARATEPEKFSTFVHESTHAASRSGAIRSVCWKIGQSFQQENYDMTLEEMYDYVLFPNYPICDTIEERRASFMADAATVFLHPAHSLQASRNEFYSEERRQHPRDSDLSNLRHMAEGFSSKFIALRCAMQDAFNRDFEQRDPEASCLLQLPAGMARLEYVPSPNP